MKTKSNRIFIIGGGMTGLASGIASGHTIFEAKNVAGGICSSYYMRPGSDERLFQPTEDGEVYHFEVGGGHWIFGDDALLTEFLQKHISLKKYNRRSGIYFSNNHTYVPYPIQHHLSFLPREIATSALGEILRAEKTPISRVRTLNHWCEVKFGVTLNELFFKPFHLKYTAKLWEEIAPQDGYKSPLNQEEVIRGATGASQPSGYNANFIYPLKGLDHLSRQLASKCNIRYNTEVTEIDVKKKILHFKTGEQEAYDKVISTIPLNQVLKLTKLETGIRPDPYTSVLVTNIGAKKGSKLPKDHWLYIPHSKTGFHRVGVYSNVDKHFLPRSHQESDDKVSIYVEQAFQSVSKPSFEDIIRITDHTVRELQSWNFIKEVEVLDPTWIEVAYTWTWPGSNWRPKSLNLLKEHCIHQAGRYGRWKFQGIRDSILEGLLLGSILK